MTSSLSRRIAAEFVGTLFLLAAVVGSGIMGERLSAGNVAIALLANTLATGTALVAIILAFGPISGSHLNPAVTLVGAWTGEILWRDALPYIAAQIAGAFSGVAVAHFMFGAPVFSASIHVRSGRHKSSASSSPPSACSQSSGDVCALDPQPYPSQSAHTSRRPIGSRHPRPLPIPPSPSPAQQRIHSSAFGQRTSFHS